MQAKNTLASYHPSIQPKGTYSGQILDIKKRNKLPDIQQSHNNIRLKL